MHYTENCEEQRPEIVVHVATTIASVQDGRLTEQIHDDLTQTALVPAEHVVDAAYITPAHIQRAQEVHGITLLGPIVADHSRQAKSGQGCGKSAFTINWVYQEATCPQGHLSRRPLRISGHDYIQVKFDKATCLACPVRPRCTDAVSGHARSNCFPPANCTRSSRATAWASTPKTGSTAMRSARASRRHSPRPSGPTAYAAPATAGSPRRTSSTSLPPWPATSLAPPTGSPKRPEDAHDQADSTSSAPQRPDDS